MNGRTLGVAVLRVILGIAVGGGLVALAALLGFVGLWTYAGFKSPGNPGLGLVALTGAVSSLAAGGMMLAWSVGARSPRLIRRVGVMFALVGVVATIWFIGVN